MQDRQARLLTQRRINAAANQMQTSQKTHADRGSTCSPYAGMNWGKSALLGLSFTNNKRLNQLLNSWGELLLSPEQWDSPNRSVIPQREKKTLNLLEFTACR